MQHCQSDFHNERVFKCYITFLALKRHFQIKSYDYFKYKGKVKISKTSFEKRRDLHFFNRLSRNKEWRELTLSNLRYDSSLWVNDLLTDEANIKLIEMKKRKQALLYHYSEELKLLNPNFNDNFIPLEGQHPTVLKLFIKGTISLETIVILNRLLDLTTKWDKLIEDDLIWPSKKLMINKFEPFMSFDLDRFRQKTIDIFKNI